MQLQVHGCLKLPSWILSISLVSYRNVMGNERAAHLIRVAVNKIVWQTDFISFGNWSRLEANEISLLPI